jgi:nucleoside-diphosphate-sugar epimerase
VAYIDQNTVMSRKGATLVTGAAGFVGRQVVRILHGREERCFACDVRTCEIISTEVCDITDQAALAKLFQLHPIKNIVHLAAILPSACRQDPELGTKVNIVGSLNLLQAAVQAKVRRFVFGSSSSVYGLGVGERPVSEQELAKPSDLYGAAKFYMEVLGQAMAETTGMEFVALRIATVVGPGVGSTASPWRSEIFEKLRASMPTVISIPELPDTLACLVHVEDLAQMLVTLATCEHVPSKLYNTPAEIVRFGELKQLVESLNPKIAVELGAQLRKAPPAVNGERFRKDFAFQPFQVTDRLKQALTPEFWPSGRA